MDPNHLNTLARTWRLSHSLLCSRLYAWATLRHLKELHPRRRRGKSVRQNTPASESETQQCAEYVVTLGTWASMVLLRTMIVQRQRRVLHFVLYPRLNGCRTMPDERAGVS